MADGPAQLGGRSAPDFSALDRTVVVLCCAKGIKGGRSTPLTLVRTETLLFLGMSKSEPRTVHTKGADGPPL